MDNPTTLLVSIMFVTILAMAIGNILMTCAEIAGGLRHPVPERLQLSWIFLMLFALLSLFWQTTVLLDVDKWLFVEFLYVMAGPMVLLFATSVITASASSTRYRPTAWISVRCSWARLFPCGPCWRTRETVRFRSSRSVRMFRHSPPQRIPCRSPREPRRKSNWHSRR